MEHRSSSRPRDPGWWGRCSSGCAAPRRQQRRCRRRRENAEALLLYHTPAVLYSPTHVSFRTALPCGRNLLAPVKCSLSSRGVRALRCADAAADSRPCQPCLGPFTCAVRSPPATSQRSQPAILLKPLTQGGGQAACTLVEAARCAPRCCSWQRCWELQAPSGAGKSRGRSGWALGPAATSQLGGGQCPTRDPRLRPTPLIHAGWDPPATQLAGCPPSWPTFKAGARPCLQCLLACLADAARHQALPPQHLG